MVVVGWAMIRTDGLSPHCYRWAITASSGGLRPFGAGMGLMGGVHRVSVGGGSSLVVVVRLIDGLSPHR